MATKGLKVISRTTYYHLESCLALTSEIISVSAKPIVDPTNFVIMVHPTCDKINADS